MKPKPKRIMTVKDLKQILATKPDDAKIVSCPIDLDIPSFWVGGCIYLENKNELRFIE